MKIFAARHEMTYEDYVESGRFTPGQLAVIQGGFDEELTSKEISVFAQPEYSVAQMFEIREGFFSGLTFRQVMLYAQPEFDENQMFIIRTDLEDGIPLDVVSMYSRPEYGTNTMEMLHEAVISNVPYEDIRVLLEATNSFVALQAVLECMIDRCDVPVSRALEYFKYLETVPDSDRLPFYVLQGIFDIFLTFDQGDPRRDIALDLCLSGTDSLSYLIEALDRGVPEDIVRSYANPEFSVKFVYRGLKDYMDNHGL